MTSSTIDETSFSEELEKILDFHASTYATATADYMTDKITELERNRIFKKSDLKTKASIKQLVPKHPQFTVLKMRVKRLEAQKQSYDEFKRAIIDNYK